ncbi:MAG: hypothetical protein FWF60_07815 [Oscillospiraceae bacterium]|nr:hypothetical protein [Oscillospiraceae bacterium]
MQAASIAKGVGIGMAVGGAVGLVGGAMTQPKYARMAKKGLDKVLKTVSGVVGAIA